jgi:hypothetical protein
VTMIDGLPANGGAATASAEAIVDLGNGETATVAELIQGNMRSRDYTQKTQQLANERKLAERGTTLLNALDQNPQEAVALIARTYGIAAPAAAPAAQPQVDEFGLPLEQPNAGQPSAAETALQGQVQQLTGTVQSLSRQQQTDALLRQVTQAEAQHGETFDRNAVLTHMQANNIPTVEMAFRDLVFADRNDVWSAAQTSQAEQAAVLQQKRGLQGVVQTTGAAGGAVEQPGTDYTAGSFRENLAAALQDTKAEMGITSLQDPVLLGT